MKGTLDWDPLDKRRKLCRLTMFYKVQYGLVSIKMPSFYTHGEKSLRHSHNLHYNVPHAEKDCLKFSFYHRTIKEWNLLPAELFYLIYLPSVDRFQQVAYRAI